MLARADVPASPVTPQKPKNAAAALVLGLLLGVGIAFLREYLDDKIRSREDLERVAVNLPVLGQIPRVPGWHDRDGPYVVSLKTPTSPGAEAYRTLRTSIQFLAVDRKLTSIQVTATAAW